MANFTGPPPLLGSGVFVDAPGHVALATSNVSLDQAQVVGVIAAFDIVNNTRPVVQLAGKATLTAAQWTAVVNTAGLIAGTAYHIDTNANPGF